MIPTSDDLKTMKATPEWAIMEGFSNGFLARHHGDLAAYASVWSADPFHHWSRQWEYPWVACRVAEARHRARMPISLLDGGSGVTFFPFYLAEVLGVSVVCLDTEPSWVEALTRIARSRHVMDRVTAVTGDLQALPFADGLFPVVTCVSVLEHLPHPMLALAEMGRVLAPDGGVIATFDIRADAAPPNAVTHGGLAVCCEIGSHPTCYPEDKLFHV